MQLASETRGAVSDVMALNDAMKELLLSLLADTQVHKVFHGHVTVAAWLS